MSDPADEMIERWKREYGRVFSLSISNYTCIFRALTFKEFSQIEKIQSVTDAEDHILKTALLHPEFEVIDNASAGVGVALIDEIIEVSAFSDSESAKEIFSNKKDKSDDIWSVMKAIVIMAIPSYKPWELDDLTFDRMAELVVTAEQIIRINQSIMGGEPTFEFEIDVEEEEAEEPKKGPASDPIAQKLHNAIQ